MAIPFAEGYAASRANLPPVSEAERKRRIFSVLQAKWEDTGKITMEDMEDAGIDLTDEQKDKILSLQREFKFGYTESSPYGEALAAEGIDKRGMTRGGYSWLANNVTATMASEYDDYLRGTDLIALFEDKENKVGYPLAIDVTVGEAEGRVKLEKSYQDVARFDYLSRRGGSREIYWVNVQSAAVESPEDGLILCPHAVIYIPNAIVEEIQNDRTVLRRIEKLMEAAGEFAKDQVVAELEIKALALLQRLEISGKNVEWLGEFSKARKDLLEELANTDNYKNMDAKARATLLNIREILTRMYRGYLPTEAYDKEFDRHMKRYMESMFTASFPLK